MRTSIVTLTAEEKELVLNHYSSSLDLEIAVLKAGLTPEQISMLYDDSDFMLRIKIEDADIQTDLILTLRDLMESDNEAIKLKATLKFAEVHYKKRFSPSKNDRAGDNYVERPLNIYLKGVKPVNT